MSAQPWFKFFPSDWRADTALRMCSPSARCLWIEMLCVMHEAEPRGHLTVNGRALTVRNLAVQAGMTQDEVTADLAELEAHGVFSRKSDGTIFSRKMVRETRKSSEQSDRSKKRWLVENTEKSEVGMAKTHPEIIPLETQKPETQIDSSPNGELSFSGEVIPFAPDPVDDAFSLYNEMARRSGLAVAMKMTPARKSALKARLKEVGAEGWAVAVAAIEGNRFFHGSNDRGWRADLDFLLQPRKLVKVIEGGYERGQHDRRDEPTDRARERTVAVFGPMALGAQEALARRRGRRGFG